MQRRPAPARVGTPRSPQLATFALNEANSIGLREENVVWESEFGVINLAFVAAQVTRDLHSPSRRFAPQSLTRTVARVTSRAMTLSSLRI